MTKSLPHNIGLDFLLTPEQKKLKYEKNVKKLMKLEKGKINEDDRQDLLEKSQDILQMKENQCQKYLSINRNEWYRRLGHFLRKFISKIFIHPFIFNIFSKIGS
jgi:hypothetical protein